ncbi:MAG: hybrid sensor histidine kinase/response regulator [Cyanobacteria bacterium M5B4]|nr:MAG: hybrid sensor histidine kinase/response regulator [Cyanobacteria bacterium M5B4]
MEDYLDRIKELELQIAELQREKCDLEELLETTTCHADVIQENLHNSEARLKALLNVVPDVIWRIRSDGLILEMVKYPTDPLLHKESHRFSSLVGKNLINVYPEEIAQLTLRNIRKALESQTLQIFEYPYILSETTAYLENRIVPFDEDHVIVFMRDVTDRIQFEKELEQAKEAADSANRSKSEFLASMSHELRTPLNAILGFSQLLSRSSNLDREQREFISAIERGGEHLLELINDVLTISKIEAGKVEINNSSFHLGRLLELIEEMMQVRAKAKGLYLRFTIEEGTPLLIKADQGKLKQIIINLLSNAIKFTKVGGVDLLASLHDARHLRFVVTDTGVGIAEEELKTLFGAFVQTSSGKNSQEGTGLGLAICHKFVQLMGGEFQVFSQVHKGTSFQFTIEFEPAQPEDIPAQPPKQRVIGIVPGGEKYRILVVEDRYDNRYLLTRLLESVGFEVCTACNGKEGVEKWQSWQPHLIWMDMNMPVMDGFAATKLIKSHPLGKDTKIIALSASVFEEERNKVINCGCDDFASKPLVEEVIFAKIAQHLGVEYIYAQETDREDEAQEAFVLTKESLQIMPPQWIQQLGQAATALKKKQVFKLIEQIPEEQANLKRSLLEIAESYQFDALAELCD